MDSAEKNEVVKIVTEKSKELDPFLKREWKVWEEKPDYKIFYIDEASGLRSVKSEAVIDKPMKEIYDYLNDLSKKELYDHYLESAKEVKSLDSNYKIHYYKYKAMMLYSPRDFYLCCKHTFTEDKIELFGTSYVSANYPVIPKIDRAEVPFGGYILTKQDANKTHVLYYTLINFHINQTLCNPTLKDVAKQVKYLKDILMK